jgi:prepilin-type N-terminal cleavage/methylation domain-containing protein
MRVYARVVQAHGFSLIETMMALCIIGFGLLAAGQLLYIGASANSLARSKSTAALAAQNVMESLGALYRQNPSEADLAIGDHGPRVIEVINPKDGTILNRYNALWIVDSVPDPRPGKVLNARRVRACIFPVRQSGEENNRPGFNKTLNVTTIFSQRTP